MELLNMEKKPPTRSSKPKIGDNLPEHVRLMIEGTKAARAAKVEKRLRREEDRQAELRRSTEPRTADQRTEQRSGKLVN